MAIQKKTPVKTTTTKENEEVTSDKWGKYNISTRVSLMVFMVSYLYVTYTGINSSTLNTTIINMVWYSALIGFLTVTLGVNGLKILLDGIARIKLGSK